ncbi:MAG: glycosyltransferase [Verrucomicrobiae bacterium]|nr:glycosyltransferase [Verrucomicrobiae bacterium]
MKTASGALDRRRDLGFFAEVIYIWATKANWRKPGPITAMGLRNAAALAATGAETHFFANRGPESETSADIRDFYGVDAPAELMVHRTRKGSAWKERFGRSVYRQALALISEKCRGQSSVAITRELGLLPPLLRLRARRPNLRVIYEAHDLHALPSYRERVKWTNRWQAFLERSLLPRADGVICITKAQQRFYSRIVPRANLINLPLGCDPVRPAADLEARRKISTLAYIGHLHAEKGLDLITRAIPKLADRGIKVVFIGGHERQMASWLARIERGKESVRMIPFLSPRELHEELARAASIGLAPLTDTFYNRYLTCPVKALDYLSHGMPTIASALPTTREVLGDAALYLKGSDPDELVDAAARILGSPELYADLTRRAEARAEELAWRHRAEAIREWTGAMFMHTRRSALVQ